MKNNKKFNILTISTKVDRGGAGKIAFNLHKKLSNGIFIYGYDRGGLKIKNQNKDILKGSKVLSPFLNFFTHKLFGIDIFNINNIELEKEIIKAEIIHLHIIHSYGFSYKNLLNILIRHNKKVIITAHDSWYYTGRCAIRHNCQEWKSLCKKCDYLDYYPSSLFDNANKEFINKTALINKIKNLTFVSPSKWLQHDLNKIYPSKISISINNGIDTTKFEEKLFTLDKKTIHLIFIINDFNDKDKVNSNFINSLLKLSYIHCHFIGQNCSFTSSNATIYGYLNKEDIISILHQSDIFLFFSKIDNYPTVLIEALCSGVHIACVTSKGSEEIVSSFDYTTLSDIENFINLLNQPIFIKKIKNSDYKYIQKNKALTKFSDKNMLKKYSELYEGCV